MKEYRYTARDSNSRLVNGVVAAESADMVAKQLLQQNLSPIEIDDSESGSVAAIKSLGQISLNAPRRDEIIMLCRQLSSLLNAGVSVSKALAVVARSTRHAGLRNTLTEIQGRLAQGTSLSDAFSEYPRYFNNLFISLVRASETIGKLPQGFDQIVINLEREQQTRKNVWTALRYPILVLVLMMVAVIIINIYAIPALSGLFSRFADELPVATRILMTISDALLVHGQYALLTVVVIGLLFWAIGRTQTGMYWYSRIAVAIPVFGEVLRMCLLARFCRNFSMLNRSGVPVLKCVDLTAAAAGNRFMEVRLRTMKEGLQSGESLSLVAKQTGLFTPLVQQILAVGEQGGKLDDLMDQVADYYEREAQYIASRFSELIQPMMIVLLAGLVGLLAMGVLMPVWEIVGNRM